uniref:AAA domain-containing protein n=1 Tax=Glossina morsitans morsitans TaxID=37546 RepID=A0A1B0FCT3_GLOMM
MIKVITGIRRCGKSFLLFTIFKRYLLENGVDVDHIIEIALDGIENEELRDPKVCFKYIKDAMKDDGKYYLLLDEVQFMSQFEEVLNSLLRMSNIDVYVTGSNSKFLSSDIVTEFRGRGDEIRIYPLSFAEFYSVYDGDYDDAWDDYMIYGGLPQITAGAYSYHGEHCVYNELLIRGYNVDMGVVDIFDKDKEGKRVRKQLEVDFV